MATHLRPHPGHGTAGGRAGSHREAAEQTVRGTRRARERHGVGVVVHTPRTVEWSAKMDGFVWAPFSVSHEEIGPVWCRDMVSGKNPRIAWSGLVYTSHTKSSWHDAKVVTRR
jgi:hypothetical protein